MRFAYRDENLSLFNNLWNALTLKDEMMKLRESLVLARSQDILTSAGLCGIFLFSDAIKKSDKMSVRLFVCSQFIPILRRILYFINYISTFID